jgi:hypothetical protein
MTDFLNEDNVRLLWEVLMDENILHSKPKELIDYFLQIFQKNLVPFYENERKTMASIPQNLIFFNKKYISFMMDTIVKLETQALSLPLIKTAPPVKKEMITYEEIQEERKTIFERELTKKRDEFQKAVALPIPPTPSFGDQMLEEKPPISELERRIQQTISERNFDLENRNYTQNTVQQAANWLNPQDTSVKKEKVNMNDILQNKLTTGPKPVQTVKYIKIEEPLIKENIIQPIVLDETPMKEKHIRWNEKLEESFFIKETNTNTLDNNNPIFSKLKILPKSLNSNDVEPFINTTAFKEVRIQQLEDEIKSIYHKMDEMSENIKQMKEFIYSQK